MQKIGFISSSLIILTKLGDKVHFRTDFLKKMGLIVLKLMEFVEEHNSDLIKVLTLLVISQFVHDLANDDDEIERREAVKAMLGFSFKCLNDKNSTQAVSFWILKGI
jgi:hypothetical protein